MSCKISLPCSAPHCNRDVFTKSHVDDKSIYLSYDIFCLVMQLMPHYSFDSSTILEHLHVKVVYKSNDSDTAANAMQ